MAKACSSDDLRERVAGVSVGKSCRSGIDLVDRCRQRGEVVAVFPIRSQWAGWSRTHTLGDHRQ
jgi:hypothetical protein